jgi:hypothetical protein
MVLAGCWEPEISVDESDCEPDERKYREDREWIQSLKRA